MDSVSREGRHVLTAVWRYSKVLDAKTNSIAYESCSLLPSTGEVYYILYTQTKEIRACASTPGPLLYRATFCAVTTLVVVYLIPLPCRPEWHVERFALR